MKTGLASERPWAAIAIAVAILLAPAAARSRTAARELPASLTNAEFARLMADFSEPGGAFHSDNFTSNEPQLVAVAKLLSSRPAGGVYIGVGPEQNFTLIAASRPRLAFVLDIRRQAIVQHLLFKAPVRAVGGSHRLSRPAVLACEAGRAVALHAARRDLGRDQSGAPGRGVVSRAASRRRGAPA